MTNEEIINLLNKTDRSIEESLSIFKWFLLKCPFSVITPKGPVKLSSIDPIVISKKDEELLNYSIIKIKENYEKILGF
jgi:hypothetical protein